MANDLVTFGDIRTAAIKQVKGDPDDTATVSFFDQSINIRYRTICSRKKWRFLRITNRSLVLPKKYTTGTASIANGSRTVAGTGTVWLNTHQNWWFKPESTENAYRVITVGSNTNLVLASPLVETSITNGGYTLYQSELALFPDLEDVNDVRIDGKPWLIDAVGPSEINRLKQRFTTREGAPVKYTIEGQAFFPGTLLQDFILGYDFLGSGKTKAISFWPHIPDADYVINIPYKIKVTALEIDADEPLIPIEHRHILLYLTLSDWYFRDRQDQTGRYYQGLAKDELNELEAKYLDTDNVLQFQAPDFRQYHHSYLMRHSRYYFDREG